MNQVIKILVVDDETDIREILDYNLKKEGFDVYTASDGRMAIELANKIIPQVILLDIMMPDLDGIETCERIRENPDLKGALIVFLTARSEDYSQIAGFSAGADDYITKPVKPKILISRINAMLKRFPHVNHILNKYDENIIQLGKILIDKEKYNITVDGQPIMLPKKEYNLFMLLTSKPSKVFTRQEIFHKIWGDDVFVGDRTIDVYIRKIREKIGEDYIKTIKGIGYKFEFDV